MEESELGSKLVTILVPSEKSSLDETLSFTVELAET